MAKKPFPPAKAGSKPNPLAKGGKMEEKAPPAKGGKKANPFAKGGKKGC